MCPTAPRHLMKIASPQVGAHERANGTAGRATTGSREQAYITLTERPAIPGSNRGASCASSAAALLLPVAGSTPKQSTFYKPARSEEGKGSL
jgi:hypothetical protein